MATERRATLLMVVAHPDDEIFHGGILSHLAARGARVQLVTLTHGEAGKIREPTYHVDDLAAARAEELRHSCQRLGISEPLLLDFHDSGRGQSLRVDDPRALANVAITEVEAALRTIIAEIAPHVIVTHDPHGGYDHPDHIVAHRAVTAAFYQSGSLGTLAPERLFYGVIERETFRTFAEVSRGRGPGGGLDPDVYGTPEPMLAVSFDASGYLERKFEAMAAHRTQFGLTLETLRNPPPQVASMLAAFRPVFERESFVLGATRGPIASWPLSDFFDGIDASSLRAEAEELVGNL